MMGRSVSPGLKAGASQHSRNNSVKVVILLYEQRLEAERVERAWREQLDQAMRELERARREQERERQETERLLREQERERQETERLQQRARQEQEKLLQEMERLQALLRQSGIDPTRTE